MTIIPGQTLHYWLAATVREARLAAGITATEVAALVGKGETSIARFEKCEVWPSGQIDRYLAAYAELLDVDDPREFYERALRDWRKKGEKPTLTRSTPAGRAQDAAARAARRKTQSRDESQGKPDATPKKREAG